MSHSLISPVRINSRLVDISCHGVYFWDVDGDAMKAYLGYVQIYWGDDGWSPLTFSRHNNNSKSIICIIEFSNKPPYRHKYYTIVGGPYKHLCVVDFCLASLRK